MHGARRCLGLLAALVLANAVWTPQAAGQTHARPNILWLTSEDHGPHMGCYGDPLARTPHVDALAARGMRFLRAWSGCPVCAPARTAIISGMYPSSLGAEHMRSMVPMPAGTKMYPQLLREAGYYCTNNAKEDYNLVKPGQVWDESSPQAHWKNRAPGQPFFAIFNSTKSHESQIRTRPHQAVTDPQRVRVPAYHPDTPEVRQDWAQYYDKVSEADADAGRRLAELAEAGLADETIVFYYADHGSGMPRNKRWPCNSGLQVPLVVYFPEKWRHLAPREYAPGTASPRLVHFVDLAPTVLSLAGIQPPSWMQGRAFAGPYQQPPREYLFGSRGRMDERNDLVRSVTDGRYVYLRNFMPHLSQGQHVSYQFETPTTRIWRAWFDAGKTSPEQSIFWRVPKAPEELYDLQTDPDEVHNLAGSPDHEPVLRRLRGVLRDHVLQTRDLGFLPEGEMHERSKGRSPFDMARDEGRYPLARILTIAEKASSLEEAATPELITALGDGESAVRYWAALGLVMRGHQAVAAARVPLVAALDDPSPYVRIVAAEALGRFGPPEELPRVQKRLQELAPPDKNGVFVAMSALWAIEALGDQAQPLAPFLKTMPQRGPSPDPRFDEYVPRLVATLGQKLGFDPTPSDPPARKAKAKGKAKASKGDGRTG
jgi:uncharacterized sulfatase